MFNKRGMGEQFNWIFIIVSGAIILGFFTMFAFKYVNLQENKQDIESIRDFGNVLNALEKLSVGDKGYSIDSNNLENGLRFGYKLKFNYECYDNKARIYINDGKYAIYELSDEVLFTEDSQYVAALDLWALPWNYPFHVTNLIYLSDTAKKYYFVYDNYNKEFVDGLDIADGINYEKIELNKLKPEKNSKIIFFMEKEPNDNLIERLNSEYSNLEFVYVNIGKKEVSFYDSEWTDGINYYSNELLYGAFFSNSGSYECTLKRALDKMKDSGNLVVERANVLNQASRKNNCNYNGVADGIRVLISGKYELEDNVKEMNKAGSGCLWAF